GGYDRVATRQSSPGHESLANFVYPHARDGIQRSAHLLADRSMGRRRMVPRLKQLFFLALLLLVRPALAAPPDPVKWSARLEPADIRAGEGGRVVVSATIDSAYHIYSTTPRSDGPFATQIQLAAGKALAAAGKVVQPKPK